MEKYIKELNCALSTHDTIVFNKAMKNKPILWMSILFILLFLAFVIANFSSSIDTSQNLTETSLSWQLTPTLIPDDLSEIGSTDGIFVMGIVIVFIVMVPVIVRKRRN